MVVPTRTAFHLASANLAKNTEPDEGVHRPGVGFEQLLRATVDNGAKTRRLEGPLYLQTEERHDPRARSQRNARLRRHRRPMVVNRASVREAAAGAVHVADDRACTQRKGDVTDDRDASYIFEHEWDLSTM